MYICGLPVVEILHEVNLRLESVHLFLAPVRKLDLLHREQLPGRLIQPFEHLSLRESVGSCQRQGTEHNHCSQPRNIVRYGQVSTWPMVVLPPFAKCAHVFGKTLAIRVG